MAILTISKEIECENCRCTLEVNSGVIICPGCKSSWPLPKGLWEGLTTGRIKIEHEQDSSNKINANRQTAPTKKPFHWWLLPKLCVHCGSELSRFFHCKSCHKINWKKALIVYCTVPLITLSSALIVDHVKPLVYLRILGDYETLNERGLAQALNSDYSKAIKYFNTALKINPNFYEAILNRGDVYESKGEHDRAISDFDAALKIRPQSDRALNSRGNAHRSKGNYDKAIADFDAAIKFRPDNHIYLSNRGNAHRSRGSYDKAIDDFDAALKIQPDDPNILNSRGDVYRRKGNYERATADYVVALRVDSNRVSDERNGEVVRSKRKKR